jgi:hypothetical protein
MFTLARIVALSAALALTNSEPAAAVAGAAAITITRIGPVALPVNVPGAALFLLRGDIIAGTLAQVPYAMGVVQLAEQSADGAWVATAASVDVARRAARAVEWTLGASDLRCDGRQRTTVDVVAIFTKYRLPLGRLTPEAWRGLVHSAPLTLTCARFDTSRLEVREVGHADANPQQPPRVTHQEDVRVVLDGVPRGALIQVCVEPTENSRIWCQDTTRPASGSEVLMGAFLGRALVRRGPNGLEFTDAYSHFWVTAYIVRAPLPVRADGLTPAEWLTNTRLIVNQSSPVEVVRAYRPGQVRLVITHLGASTDSRVRLADSVTRVEGLFRPLPLYVANPREHVTLLVRRVSERAWSVAGHATMAADLTTWIVIAADLDRTPGPAREERLALAVLSDREFSRDESVTEDRLRRSANSISDEMRFSLFEARW